MQSFDARGYWEERLEKTYALDGVGWSGLGPALNTWMYRVRRHVFLRALRPLTIHPRDLRVLDVGSGTGFYVDRWHELGVPRVTGADLTETAVGRLQKAYPDDTFVRFDVSESDPPLDAGGFDLISAMDVLFHIVEDERFERAFATIFSLVAPGGHFVFSDNFVTGEVQRSPHQVSRPRHTVERIVRDAGFEIVGRRPMFFLLNSPIDSSSRALHASWRLLATASAQWNAVGRVLGALAYPIELALVSHRSEGPSTELMICRRPPVSVALPAGQ
jgi:2-polyprenyl-3-methyl-5-hydroxy-6-metoxy-1,4-benzoquinol methylase